MKNWEKYTDADSRIRAFNKRKCAACEYTACDRYSALNCFNRWLDEEAAHDKPNACLVCGREPCVMHDGQKTWVQCSDICGMRGRYCTDDDNAIDEWNRLRRNPKE